MSVLYHNILFDGIVMYRRNYRDNDLIVKVLTDKYGKKTFLIHNGAMNISKLSSSLLNFSYGKYIGNISDNGFSYIKGFYNIQQYSNIINDIFCNAYAIYILDLLDHAYDDNQIIYDWYNKVKTILSKINSGLDGEILSDIFAIQLLPIFGLDLNFHNCVICGRKNFNLDFSQEFGGMICSKHWSKDKHRFHISLKTAYYLGLFSSINVSNIRSISIKNNTKKELSYIIDYIYDDMVGLVLKSKSFIKKMKNFTNYINE